MWRRIHNRLERYAASPWRLRAYVSAADPIVIGACPRSGTTLLRRILDTHSEICCGPESSLLLPGRPDPDRLALGYGVAADQIRQVMRETHSQAEFVDRFMAAYAAGVGTHRWAEKTPLNIRHVDWIWRHFPKASFVHVIRDGRDTVCSMRTHANRRLVDGQWQHEPQRQGVESLVRRWNADVRRGVARRGDPRYHEIRYEDLVSDPRATLEPLFAFLGEPFEEGVLDYRTDTERAREPAEAETPSRTGSIHSQSVGRWRTDLTAAEQQLFKRVAGPLLIELGYERNDDW
jgi:protein-tyrosine sulfotransferase